MLAVILAFVASYRSARRVERVQRCFSPEGRLLRWPSRREDQVLALWGLWAQIPSRRDFTEQEISQVLKTLHDFGDHALLVGRPALRWVPSELVRLQYLAAIAATVTPVT